MTRADRLSGWLGILVRSLTLVVVFGGAAAVAWTSVDELTLARSHVGDPSCRLSPGPTACRSVPASVSIGYAFVHARPVSAVSGSSGASGITAAAAHPTASSPLPVHLALSVGYGEGYRPLTVVPVRITAHNRTASTVSGMISVPDLSSNAQDGPTEPAVYQQAMVLPPNASKEATLYLPAAAVDGEVQARLRVNGTVVGYAHDLSSVYGGNEVVVGALTANPTDTAWLSNYVPHGGEWVRVLHLTAQSLTPNSGALANLDVVVLSDGSVSTLDAAQLSALGQYVYNGGGLVLVGGPAWQQTLKSLPPFLVPGTLAGSATLPNLDGLASIAATPHALRPNDAATVSILNHPQGSVLARQHGIPLAVDDSVGSGHIIYLAFNPGYNPIASWSGARGLVTSLLLNANPAAAARGPNWQQSAMPTPLNDLPNQNASLIGSELQNVPSAPMREIILFLILAVLAVILVGPMSFWVLRRLKRQEFLWLTVPIGAILCLGMNFGLSAKVKNNATLVNTIAMVTLDGPSSARPASMYMSLFAPVKGDYTLTYKGAGDPEAVPVYGANPGVTQFQEGAQTNTVFQKMSTWSMRAVGVSTTVDVPGTIRSDLHIASNGAILGWVRNTTKMRLIHPAIVAGRNWINTPDVAPGQSVRIRVTPNVDIYNNSTNTIWNRMYGQYPYMGWFPGARFPAESEMSWLESALARFGLAGGDDASRFAPGGVISFTGNMCCLYSGSPMPEPNLEARLRDAATQIPEAQTVSDLGEVQFVAWNEQPLGSISVDGATPDRRDLNLIVKPLSVGFEPGPFTIRPGTFGANLVSVQPAPHDSGNCCGAPVPGAIELGNGGSATFQFTLPDAGNLHFNHLEVHVNVGGARGKNTGRVWDWHAGRWVICDLSRGYAGLPRPGRFVSDRGDIMLKVLDRDHCTDMYFQEVRRYVQISGIGVVK